MSGYEYNYEDMVQRINVYYKKSERRAADLKQSTADFEDATKITVDSDSVITQGKKVRMKVPKSNIGRLFLMRKIK